MSAELIASKNVVCVKPGTPIVDVAKLMAQRSIGFLVVSSDCERDLAGVVSERDIIRALASGLQLSEPVDAIMTRRVIYVHRNAPIWEIAYLMREHKIRHVVVTDGDKIFGIISIRDLLRESEVIKRLAEYAEERIDEISAYD
ncbi:putative signal-transduction protein containing cAMP-binding and CBS domains [Pyrobaculum oguniense TE7]|uniref:Signal-transduction protein containing cAMP-binding and CBS domains n=1 Tax=Pyrobaculum oguniense (strain DSM 13380 / JCM 10595 / TE7) TaxID=698757 RepID=H6QAQ9_PYROT|nr:putative signal-transduction protein containing cAMP-binding and CBS domains [Pyrobaculum oguniense TE7]